MRMLLCIYIRIHHRDKDVAYVHYFKRNGSIQGQYLPTILKNILCLFSPRFAKLECNTTSDWLNLTAKPLGLANQKEWLVNTNPVWLNMD